MLKYNITKFILMGFPLDYIAYSFGISIEEVQELIQTINKTYIKQIKSQLVVEVPIERIEAFIGVNCKYKKWRELLGYSDAVYWNMNFNFED